jgi:hypothetical protein
MERADIPSSAPPRDDPTTSGTFVFLTGMTSAFGTSIESKAHREGVCARSDLVCFFDETSPVDAVVAVQRNTATSQQPPGAMYSYVSRGKFAQARVQWIRKARTGKGPFLRLRICALYDVISINILAVSRAGTPTPGSSALAHVAPRASALLRRAGRRPNKGEIDGDGLVQQLLLVRAVYCRAGFLDGSIFDERITLITREKQLISENASLQKVRRGGEGGRGGKRRLSSP